MFVYACVYVCVLCVFLCFGVFCFVVILICWCVACVYIYYIIMCSCYYSTATVTGTISPRNSNLLNFFANYNRIIASNLLGTMLSVVKGAIVFIGIAMHGTV